MVEGQNDSFSAASKGYKRYQTMNKGIIWRNSRHKKNYMLYIYKCLLCSAMRIRDFT